MALLRQHILARLHFGLLLLVFQELVFWTNASTYGPFDWLVLGAIYAALGALLLDVVARFQVSTWQTWLLAAGLYGLLRGALLEEILFEDFNRFSFALTFLPLGVNTLAFLLALGSFRLLNSGEATGLYAFLIAAALGLGAGFWAKWASTIEQFSFTRPDWALSLPILLSLLGLSGIWPIFLEARGPRHREDWILTPYPLVGMGVCLGLGLAWRQQEGYIDWLSLFIFSIIGAVIVYLLYASQDYRPHSALQALTPPKLPLLPAWLILLAPFAAFYTLAYFMSDTRPFFVEWGFQFLLILSSFWLPLVSAWLGVKIFSQLIREGY
jgi:hypothetical protein